MQRHVLATATPPSHLPTMTTQHASDAVAQAISALWTAEMPATLRVIAAVRGDRRDYRPHPRSRSAWELLVHLAVADLWFLESIARGSFSFDAAAAKAAESNFATAADVKAFYEASIPPALERLTSMPSAELAEPVDFFGMMNMPRASWIGFAMNHSIHHRGQLSAYLRPMEGRVPDIYGPSGDSEAKG